MKIYDYPDVKSVIVSGDIHGEFGNLINKVIVQYGITDALVIVAGDCGFGFERQGFYEAVYKRFQKRLSKNNIYLAFVRGNHDNPAYFKNNSIPWKRFQTIEDYDLIRARDHHILCVGGAVSIDRIYRYDVCPSSANHYNGPEEFRPANYWKDESPYFEASALDEIINSDITINTIITHTAPSFCEFTSKDGIRRVIEQDPELEQDCTDERWVMDRIFEHLRLAGKQPERWLYGHFHASWHSTIEGTAFTMLDCIELKEIRLNIEE